MSEKRNLLQLIEDSITSGEVSLPPANGVLGKLQQLTADPDFDLNEAVEVITRDQSLTAEILKVANSSFYGGLTEITTVKNAAVRLGAPEVVRLATLVSEKKNYCVESPHLKEFIEPLWQHSMAVAQGAGWLAKKLGYPNLVNEAFVAGLMHDVGSMALVRVLDDLSAGDPARLPENVTFARGDVNDVPRLWTLLQDVDCVYHLAARVSVPESVRYPRDYNAANVGGTMMRLYSLNSELEPGVGYGAFTGQDDTKWNDQSAWLAADMPAASPPMTRKFMGPSCR